MTFVVHAGQVARDFMGQASMSLRGGGSQLSWSSGMIDERIAFEMYMTWAREGPRNGKSVT